MQAVATEVNAPLVLSSRTEVEKVLRRGARVASLLAGAEAARDTAVVAAGEVNKERIERLGKEVAEIKAAVEAWARENRSEFEGKQSLELRAGVMAFRVGNRKLDLLPGWTWEKVIFAVTKPGRLARVVLKNWRSWIQIEFKVDKRKILSDTVGDNPSLSLKDLKSVGMTIAQDETFSVEFVVKAQP